MGAVSCAKRLNAVVTVNRAMVVRSMGRGLKGGIASTGPEVRENGGIVEKDLFRGGIHRWWQLLPVPVQLMRLGALTTPYLGGPEEEV
jgi:hypothetical protein